MSSLENPYDMTLWDPIDLEQAIEDPMHGPEATLSLLSIPPMKRADGSYYVFGGFYACGTSTFDAEGRPFITIGAAANTMADRREMFEHQDWIEAHELGMLPPIEEMDLPAFQFDQKPYLVVPAQTIELPTFEINEGRIVAPEHPNE